jgi:hypothetical protein
MIRPDTELHRIPPSEWTPAEVFSHLRQTFDVAARQHPDLLEQYQIQLSDAEQDVKSQAAIMREGLRNTFSERHSTKYQTEGHASHAVSDA